MKLVDLDASRLKVFTEDTSQPLVEDREGLSLVDRSPDDPTTRSNLEDVRVIRDDSDVLPEQCHPVINDGVCGEGLDERRLSKQDLVVLHAVEVRATRVALRRIRVMKEGSIRNVDAVLCDSSRETRREQELPVVDEVSVAKVEVEIVIVDVRDRHRPLRREVVGVGVDAYRCDVDLVERRVALRFDLLQHTLVLTEDAVQATKLVVLPVKDRKTHVIFLSSRR